MSWPVVKEHAYIMISLLKKSYMPNLTLYPNWPLGMEGGVAEYNCHFMCVSIPYIAHVHGLAVDISL